MTQYYLLDHRNPNGDRFYASRRRELRVIVVHITAGLEDLDGPPDASAERTARYAATTKRRVSWHSGSDTDSHLYLLPDSYTAWHCQNYNSLSYGHEISKADVDWHKMPSWWVERTLVQAARALRPIVEKYELPLQKLSRSQVDAGMRGFAAHQDLDPTRRTDPGRTFPWVQFFGFLKVAPRPPRRPLYAKGEHMPIFVRKEGTKTVFVETNKGLLPLTAEQFAGYGDPWGAVVDVPDGHELLDQPKLPAGK